VARTLFTKGRTDFGGEGEQKKEERRGARRWWEAEIKRNKPGAT